MKTRNHFPKEAMILAAGRGERLRPLTLVYPKPLLPLANVPMIERLIVQLRDYGVERMVINLHHLGALISDYLGDGSRFGVTLRYCFESELLGTGGGIANMLPHINGEDFICLNGDTVLTADLSAAWETHRQHHSSATMVLVPMQTGSAEQSISGQIFLEKTTAQLVGLLEAPLLTTPQQIICNFTGTHFFQSQFLRTVFTEVRHACIIRQGYLHWLAAKAPLFGHLDHHPLLDTGTIRRYLDANAYILRLNRQKQLIGANVSRGKKVIIGDNVSIAPDCTIGDGAKIHDAILLPGVRVEAGTVTRSTVLWS